MGKIPTLQSVIPMLDTRTGAAMPERGPDEGGRAERKAIYDSRRWRERVRPQKLARDPLCQRCLYIDVIEQATTVDHWLPMAQGGAAWDDDNLVSLCTPCHSHKTQCEQRGDDFPPVTRSSPRTRPLA